MAAIPADLDPNDPINILLRPFDTIPKPAAAPTDDVDPNAQALADAQASQDAAAAAEAERQRKLAEEKANILRQTTIGGKNNNTIFGGAEGEVVYESNVRPSGRRWEPTNRVEIKRTVVDFNMSEPLPPEQMVNESASASLLSSSPVTAFSQPDDGDGTQQNGGVHEKGGRRSQSSSMPFLQDARVPDSVRGLQADQNRRLLIDTFFYKYKSFSDFARCRDDGFSSRCDVAS